MYLLENQLQVLTNSNNVMFMFFQMTVGSTQRFYVVIKMGAPTLPKPAAGNLGPAPGAGLNSGAGVWECVWQVGARLLAAVGGSERPHYLPLDGSTKDFGRVCLLLECNRTDQLECVANL